MPEQNVTTQVERSVPLAGLERRAWVRYSLRKVTFCHAMAAQPYDRWWRATVQDISLSGVRLTCQRHIPPGTLLAVELEGMERLLLAHVIHTTPVAVDSWKLGCEFLCKLSDAELHAVL